MSEQNDQKIIDRILNGEPEVFNVLILKYQQQVASRVYKIINNKNDVPDIVQETFIKAFRGLAKFKNESLFYTWLYRIATNEALSYLDRNKRRPFNRSETLDDEENNFDYALADNSENPEQSFINREQYEKAIAVISSLPDKLKAPLLMREQDDNSYEEIAAILDISIATVKSRIFRAREIVRNELIKLKIL